MAATPIDRPTAGAQARPRPNIVVIVTDDQRIDMMSSMPAVQRDLVAKGMSFSNAFVNDSLCCPSRISILRGQHAHTTRVYGVSGPFGGYGKVKRFGLQSSTLATWLGDAGYRTAMIGKYMNLYTSSFATEVPAGWDYWAALVTTTPDAYYYGYEVSFSTSGAPATTIPHGTAPADYSTRVYSSHAQEFVRSTPADQPLFLYFAPTAPHMPATADPIDTAAACTANPELPSFGEADVSDKPAWVRSKPWSVALAQSHRVRWVKQCRSLLSVDRAVGDVIDTLAAEGRLEDTLFVYTSDNGLFNGEHRLDGKKAPYEESINVPLVVRYDGVTEPGSVDDHLVMNIDIAPTALTYAGVSAPTPIPCSSPCVPQGIGGRSLAPLLDGTPPRQPGGPEC